MKKGRVSLSRSLKFVLLSIFLISGVPTLAYLNYQNYLEVAAKDPAYSIRAIVQSGELKEALPTQFFAEALELSIDQPSNLVELDLEQAQKKLRAYPFIEKVKLKKIMPDTLHIDYKVKRPIAKLLDFSNTVMDQEGSTFPLLPYFSPKSLPKVYLGIFEQDPGKQVDPGKYLSRRSVKTVLHLLRLAKRHDITLNSIDLSSTFTPILGKREIVLEIDDTFFYETEKGLERESYPKVLRLNLSHYEQSLRDYMLICSSLRDHAKSHQNKTGKDFPLVLIDFRLSDIAYFSFPGNYEHL